MLKVATYNIRKCVGLDWRRNPERIAAVLGEVSPRIVALQEADRRFGARSGTLPPEALAEATGLRIAPLGDSGPSHGWHGNAILVSDDIEVIKVERVHLPILEPRGALMAELEADGARLRLIGAHLGLHGPSRVAQAHALINMLEHHADGAFELVMGDFNQWRAHRGPGEVMRQRMTPAPTRASFHAARPVAPIDRIFVGAGVGVARCGVHASPLSRKASDHLPVWAELRLGARTP